jgi:NAD(P)-dependent dehydrogenase (short-subunit alcohol dehydrogenase family)
MTVDSKINTDLSTVYIADRYHSIVVLTGASTGIGYATARFLAEKDIFVIATVRKSVDIEKLRKLGEGVCPVLLDVCFPEQVTNLAQDVEQLLIRHNRPLLDALINNAGIALGGPLVELDDETLQRQLEVNVVAPMRMVRAFAKLLGVRKDATKGGRIIQVSSISGERAMPFVGPYTASKFALEGLSDSLRMELLPFGVDVIIVQPGPINTEIWDKAPTPEESPFTDGLYDASLTRFYNWIVNGGRKGLPPRSIAEVIYKALSARSPKTRYTKTPGYFTRVLVPKYLPTRTFDRLIGRILHLLPHQFHQSTKKSPHS